MITGIQGIGKSFSLWLFAELIRISPKAVRQIKVVLIPDCVHLSFLKGEYIVQQFILQFPEIQEFKELLKTTIWEKQKDFIYKFIKNFRSAGNIIVLMVNQINGDS